MAGSESQKSTNTASAALKEGANINKSLFTLGRCISALAAAGAAAKAGKGSGKAHIPFRDSVLTQVLRTSLTGNSKTTLLAAISPADINYSETLSTLRFADNVKRIETKAVRNVDPQV